MISVAPLVTAAQPCRAPCPYVLLVDDHEQSLRRLSIVVASAGHHCRTATSAAQALGCCDDQRPQVVVTDLTMPNLNGRRLADLIRARYLSVPLILMTGQDLEPESLADLRRTFTAVLKKPLDIGPFLGWLDRLMPADGNATRP